jgi:hypothetical protein
MLLPARVVHSHNFQQPIEMLALRFTLMQHSPFIHPATKRTEKYWNEAKCYRYLRLLAMRLKVGDKLRQTAHEHTERRVGQWV